MNGKNRRAALGQLLTAGDTPRSASDLAAALGVSRQIVVGDVALLRAEGIQIMATPRGYVVPPVQTAGVVRTLACVHSVEEMGRELRLVVDQGGWVEDVVVEHPVYGELRGQLQLRSRYDVERFLERVGKSQPLSALTDGIHLHTVTTPDEHTMTRVVNALHQAGFLVPEE